MSERVLKAFGKPERLPTCECERTEEAGLLQAFQLLNGEQVNAMLNAEENRIGKLLTSGVPATTMLDELYLATLSRYPTPAERAKLLPLAADAKDNRTAYEDIAWGLVNAKNFLLRR